MATRAKIVLAAAEGRTNAEITQTLGVSRPTVTTWRKRFAEHRLDGLHDEPRPGAPRTVSDEQVHEVVTRTLETRPKDATHWSTRSLAVELGLSQSTVARIWRAFNLQPHRSETFKLLTDPMFVEKVRDVVGLYSASFRNSPTIRRTPQPVFSRASLKISARTDAAILRRRPTRPTARPT